jgi:4-hydroxy-2-oxoheptanedioate aldolase
MLNRIFKILETIQSEIVSLKIDLETECFSSDDRLFLKEISQNFNLPISTKIGGCEAVHDLFVAKELNSKIITAPMIESTYALSKFVNASVKVFDKATPELFINIETISTYENLKIILNSEYSKYLTGIVIGRNDLVQSMGYSKNEVNNDTIFKITVDILEKARQKNLKTIIGGNLTPQSISFLGKIPTDLLDYFETRVIIFDYKKLLEKNRGEAVKKALEFELLLLENKKSIENIVISRIQELKQRQNLISIGKVPCEDPAL